MKTHLIIPSIFAIFLGAPLFKAVAQSSNVPMQSTTPVVSSPKKQKTAPDQQTPTSKQPTQKPPKQKGKETPQAKPTSPKTSVVKKSVTTKKRKPKRRKNGAFSTNNLMKVGKNKGGLE